MHGKGLRRSIKKVSLFIALLALVSAPLACPETTERPAIVKGKVLLGGPESVNSSCELTVAAISDGKEVALAAVDSKTGEYSIKIDKPGTYDLRLKTPMGVLDFVYQVRTKAGETVMAQDIPFPSDACGVTPPTPPDVPVKPDEPVNPPVTHEIPIEPPSTVTPPTPPISPGEPDTDKGASLSGTVYPPEATVKVLDEGRVVAEATASGGNFTVENVKPGLYDIEFSAPGYVPTKLETVAVSMQGATTPLNEMLFYNSPLDGVDYETGVVTATGVGKMKEGMPRMQAVNPACKAAAMIARRNLLDTIMSLQLGEDKSIRSLDTAGTVKTTISGVIKGAREVSRDVRDDGSCEVTLQMNIQDAEITKYFRQVIE